MENKETFIYTYSAKEQEEIKAIRKKYAAKEQTEDKMAQLRFLHAIPTRKAQTASLIIGIVGALIMGTGMSLVMTELGEMLGMTEPMVPGIVIGVVGMILVLSTYPIYKKILSRRKKKYAPQVMKLSEKLLQK